MSPEQIATGNEKVFSISLKDYCDNQNTDSSDYELQAAAISYSTDSFHHFSYNFGGLEERAIVRMDKRREEAGAEAVVGMRLAPCVTSNNSANLLLYGTALIRKQK
jgi:hypothetical protein